MSLLSNGGARRIRVEGAGPIFEGVAAACARRGYRVVPEGPAPLFILANVTRIVKPVEYLAPALGTLCFHPSLLPRHRGRDAVYWTVKMGDTETGVTWFWVTEHVDAGPIAIQKRIAMPENVSPRDLYYQHLVPLGVAALDELLAKLEAGDVPRVEQDERLATYERPRQRIARPAADAPPETTDVRAARAQGR